MLPCMSVMATIVLLNVARMFAMPDAIFFAPLALIIFLVAASSASNSAAVGAATGAAPAAGAAAASGALAGSACSPGLFRGAFAALPSAVPFGPLAWGTVSGFASCFATGFLDLVSSAIKEPESVDA